MIATPLIFAATSDLAGKLRGKAFPESDLEMRLVRGLGWTPTNIQITCFDAIAETPFGPFGDLVMMPDPASAVAVDFDDGLPAEQFIMADLQTLDGAPWSFCTRAMLKAALARLHELCGAQLRVAFEHEFQLKGDGHVSFDAYGIGAFRQRRDLCETLMAALAAAGLTPNAVHKEYGAAQIEVTVAPELGLRGADAAVILRQLARASAQRHGLAATFTPIRDPSSVGNGVHMHLSLVDGAGQPLGYDAEAPGGLSALAGSFAAGILRDLDAILAFTAPSAISYQRLSPHRWSAAYNNLGQQDREAAIRICPISTQDPTDAAQQFNLEFRAADAAATPYLALAAVVQAGAQGIADKLPAPAITESDLSELSVEDLAASGHLRLPQSLDAALTRMRASDRVSAWFPEGFPELYEAHKRGELAYLDGMDLAAQCRAYEATY